MAPVNWLGEVFNMEAWQAEINASTTLEQLRPLVYDLYLFTMPERLTPKWREYMWAWCTAINRVNTHSTLALHLAVMDACVNWKYKMGGNRGRPTRMRRGAPAPVPRGHRPPRDLDAPRVSLSTNAGCSERLLIRKELSTVVT